MPTAGAAITVPVSLTPDQESFRAEIHAFAKNVVRPAAIAVDKIADPVEAIAPTSPIWEPLRQAFTLGYHKIGFPEALGGIELDPVQNLLFSEELAWGSVDMGFTVASAGFALQFAAAFGSDEILNRYVGPFLELKEPTFLSCWAITEPNHGSDTLTFNLPHFRDPESAGQLRARRDGDFWIINGQKSAWVSNSPIATHALVYLTIDPTRGMAGGGVAFVPLDLPGISKGRPLDKHGQRAFTQGEIFFDNVRLPREFMLVDCDGYVQAVETILTMANAAMGTGFAAVARAAYEEAFAYAQQRVQGGRPICEHQLIQKKLFDMWVKVEAATYLSRSVQMRNAAEQGEIERSISSKVFCTQAAFEVASEAVQVHGGYGMTKEFFVEKLLRDARASLIEDGTNEVLSLAGFQRLLDKARNQD